MEEYLNPEFWYNTIMNFLPDVILAIVTLIVGLWVINWISRLFRKAMERKQAEPSLTSFLNSIISIGLKVLLFISIAGIFGVQTASFVAVLGALAFAVGLALQGTLSHFASGVLILMFRYYKVGDYVEVANVEGSVKEIQIFNTILTTGDNRQIIIPNGLITSNKITNFTVMGTRRMELIYGIGYNDDIDKAREVIKEQIATCLGAMSDPEPQIFVKELADSSVNLTVRIWTSVEDFWPTYWDMQEKVKKAFDSNNISIPYPQMDVHYDTKDAES